MEGVLGVIHIHVMETGNRRAQSFPSREPTPPSRAVAAQLVYGISLATMTSSSGQLLPPDEQANRRRTGTRSVDDSITSTVVGHRAA